MRKLLLTLSMTLVFLAGMAVPAKRGVWKTLTLADGKEVEAMLVGDEHGHFWMAEDGTAYIEAADADYYVLADAQQITAKAKARRNKVNVKRVQRMKAPKTASSYNGKKKGLIILVNFKDTKFKSANNKAYFNRIANVKNFSVGNFRGSMSDYFLAQSLGQFELDFDIVGPVAVSQNASYYGTNDRLGNDLHPGEMVTEAVKLVKDSVSNWKQYDWDNDFYVDQVYVVYAGKGEADGGATTTIWPHAYTLSDASTSEDGKGPVSVGTNLYVDTYACGAELNGSGTIAGIGTMCHEFSHCLGFPDFYDTEYQGGIGMCSWDIMDSGSYNDDGYLPAGYTSYERWVAGWIEPTVLEAEDVQVDNMGDLQGTAESYIVYNKGNRNEYFLLENRQLTGWDQGLPGSGLLILHVDYDEQIWADNIPNNTINHQRMTWIAADNNYKYRVRTDGYQKQLDWDLDGLANDPFPYNSNNKFNASSTPAAKFFNKNANGSYYLDSSIEGITRNNDGTVSFRFVAGNPDTPSDIQFVKTTTVESGKYYLIVADNSGSLVMAKPVASDKRYGWLNVENVAATNGVITCNDLSNAFLITSKAEGYTITQADERLLYQTGTYDSFNVANNPTDGYVWSVVPNADGTVKLINNSKKKYVQYSVTHNSYGCYSDEQGIMPSLYVETSSTGISELKMDSSKVTRIYTLDGRYVGTDFTALKHGIYIINGKKVIK